MRILSREILTLGLANDWAKNYLHKRAVTDAFIVDPANYIDHLYDLFHAIKDRGGVHTIIVCAGESAE